MKEQLEELLRKWEAEKERLEKQSEADARNKEDDFSQINYSKSAQINDCIRDLKQIIATL